MVTTIFSSLQGGGQYFFPLTGWPPFPPPPFTGGRTIFFYLPVVSTIFSYFHRGWPPFFSSLQGDGDHHFYDLQKGGHHFFPLSYGKVATIFSTYTGVATIPPLLLQGAHHFFYIPVVTTIFLLTWVVTIFSYFYRGVATIFSYFYRGVVAIFSYFYRGMVNRFFL